MARELEVLREQDLPATPEQVWDAVATGAGNLGWLYPMEVEPRVGGKGTRGGGTTRGGGGPGPRGGGGAGGGGRGGGRRGGGGKGRGGAPAPSGRGGRRATTVLS